MLLDHATDSYLPSHRLLRDISGYATVLKNTNVIRLFVFRERVSQELRASQLRISNLASRLQVSSGRLDRPNRHSRTISHGR